LAYPVRAGLTAGVQIERFDPVADPSRLRACYEIVADAARLDDPDRPPSPYPAFASWWTPGDNDDPRQTWLATNEAGQPAGCYLLTLSARENTELARSALVVAPGHRRAGLGTALLAHCKAQARKAGRTRLADRARDGSPGAAFAVAAGAAGGIGTVRRRLTIDDNLAARLAGLRAEAGLLSAGYHLESWLGATPAGYLDEVAALSAAMADAPRDAGVEPKIWDAGRVARLDQIAVSAGQRLYSVGARHAGTGQLAAITQLAADPDLPSWARQSLTAVLAGHRGHRLGLLVKIAMLDLLRPHEPALRYITTGNADANEHMIAINARIGFAVSAVHRWWELSLS
jgi:GNAT superfamily N-acetyltransferase